MSHWKSRYLCSLLASAVVALPLTTTARDTTYNQHHRHHKEAATQAARETDQLPAVGHTYRVDLGAGNAFEIAFGHDSDMTFTKLQEPGKGQVETIHYTHRKLRDGLYMVYWQEKDNTTVVHVEDFENGTLYSNITRPDGQFYNGFSTLEKVK